MELNERNWEKVLGPNTEKRTVKLGQENTLYRERAHLPAVNIERQTKFNVYIHDIGAELLKSNLTEEKENSLVRESLIKKQGKVAKLLRKKIKVTDFEDGGLSVSIDQEWDTSTWSEELIHAGCEALIMIFYGIDNENGANTNTTNSTERKERAVYMLQKLLYRHKEAETYLRRNIEKTIGKAVSKIIRNGKTYSILDLLYILHGCKETFCIEMSQYNFNGRSIEMFIQEAKLAAILIQHTYRAKRSRTLFSSYQYRPVLEGFGSVHEVKMSRLQLINSRSSELRDRWRVMHPKVKESLTRKNDKINDNSYNRNSIGGIRGPVYLNILYSQLTLEIILHLTSNHAGKFAHGNREDVIRSNGCILLTTYLANTTSRLCFISVEIMANVSNVSESLEPMIETGFIDSCCRVLKYMRLIGVGKNVMKIKKNDNYPLKKIYLLTISIVSNLGIHAAGIYRALHKYRYIKESRDNNLVEKVDYLHDLNHCKNKEMLFKYIENYLGHSILLKELSTSILCTALKDVQYQLLFTLFTLLCGHAHNNTVGEVTAMAGELMIYLVKLLHDSDENISNISLCIFLQICTLDSSRQSLLIAHFQQYITPLNTFYATKMNYDKHIYQRSLLISIAMTRQLDWRFYDPQELPIFMLNNGNKKEYNDTVRQAIYLNILKTMKRPDLSLSENFQISDLVILPTNESDALGMSKSSLNLSVRDIIAFFCHPEDMNYSEKLPLEESSATCTVFEGYSSYQETALLMYSPSIINFIGKYLYLCKYLFLGKPMLDAQIMVIFNGIISGAKALQRFSISCSVSKDINDADSFVLTERKTELITSAIFFVNTLSTSHPKLDKSLKDLQVQVGVNCLAFLGAYAEMLMKINGKSKVCNLSDMYQAAICVVNVRIILLTYLLILIFINTRSLNI